MSASVAVEQIGPPIEALPRLLADRVELLELLGGLEVAAWQRPTACAGWTVHDVVAHILGDDLGRLARSRDGWQPLVPRPEESIGRFVDRINDEWVVAARRLSPRTLVDLLRLNGEQLGEMWAARDPDEIADGVSWAGMATGPVWLDIGREMTEYWVHEQQIREAIRVPTREGADLAAILDVFARGLPFALSGTSRPEGSAVRVVAGLSGGGEVAWTIERSGIGWSVVSEQPGREVDATATIDARLLWRRWTRQGDVSSVLPAVTAGDEVLVRAALDHVAIIRSDA